MNENDTNFFKVKLELFLQTLKKKFPELEKSQKK